MKTMKVKGYPVAESYGRYYIDTTQDAQERLVWTQAEREGVYIAVDASDDTAQLHVDASVYASVYEPMPIDAEHDFISDIYNGIWNNGEVLPY